MENLILKIFEKIFFLKKYFSRISISGKFEHILMQHIFRFSENRNSQKIFFQEKYFFENFQNQISPRKNNIFRSSFFFWQSTDLLFRFLAVMNTSRDFWRNPLVGFAPQWNGPFSAKTPSRKWTVDSEISRFLRWIFCMLKIRYVLETPEIFSAIRGWQVSPQRNQFRKTSRGATYGWSVQESLWLLVTAQDHRYIANIHAVWNERISVVIWSWELRKKSVRRVSWLFGFRKLLATLCNFCCS